MKSMKKKDEKEGGGAKRGRSASKGRQDAENKEPKEDKKVTFKDQAAQNKAQNNNRYNGVCHQQERGAPTDDLCDVDSSEPPGRQKQRKQVGEHNRRI